MKQPRDRHRELASKSCGGCGAEMRGASCYFCGPKKRKARALHENEAPRATRVFDGASVPAAHEE